MLHKPLIAAALALVLTGTAAAQTMMGSIPLAQTGDMLNRMILNDALRERDDDDGSGRSRPRASARQAESVASVRIPLGAPRMPALMAQHYAPADRAQAQRTFHQMLTGYTQIARQLGVPVNDVSGAVAAFIAGSWMAYTDIDVADEDFPTLVAQMRTVLRRSPAFMRASVAEKQDLYEQMAILGTTMALTREGLRRRHDPALAARTRQTAHDYLAQFLKSDPNTMVIDERGLSIGR